MSRKAKISWENGCVLATYVEAWCEDNDPSKDNSRDFEFWEIESQQTLAEDFHTAVRYRVE